MATNKTFSLSAAEDRADFESTDVFARSKAFKYAMIGTGVAFKAAWSSNHGKHLQFHVTIEPREWVAALPPEEAESATKTVEVDGGRTLPTSGGDTDALVAFLTRIGGMSQVDLERLAKMLKE